MRFCTTAAFFTLLSVSTITADAQSNFLNYQLIDGRLLRHTTCSTHHESLRISKLTLSSRPGFQVTSSSSSTALTTTTSSILSSTSSTTPTTARQHVRTRIIDLGYHKVMQVRCLDIIAKTIIVQSNITTSSTSTTTSSISSSTAALCDSSQGTLWLCRRQQNSTTCANQQQQIGQEAVEYTTANSAGGGGGGTGGTGTVASDAVLSEWWVEYQPFELPATCYPREVEVVSIIRPIGERQEGSSGD